MASIRKRLRKDGTATYAVLYTLDGVQTSDSLPDMKSAQKYRQMVNLHGGRKARELAGFAAPKRTNQLDMTVRQWLEHHLDHLTGVEPETVHRYRSYMNRDITPHFGDRPLTELSHDEISVWVNTMQSSGASAKTILNKHGYLAGALNAAVRAGKIPANPCDQVRLPRWHREEMVFLTKTDYQTLRNAIPDYWRPLVDFLVASGCRWGEAVALQPVDVDRIAGTIRINKAWKQTSSGYRVGNPKTRRSVRTVNVGTDILDALDYSNEWLFVNRHGGPVRAQGFHNRVWGKAVKQAQSDGLKKKPRVHDLRHTHASWLIAAGVPLPVISRRLGHESITVTVDMYGHLDRSSDEAAAAAVGAMLT